MQYITMAEFIALPDETKKLIRDNYKPSIGSKISFENNEEFYIVKSQSDYSSDILLDEEKKSTFIPWLTETDLREILEKVFKMNVVVTKRKIVFGYKRFKRNKENLLTSYLDAINDYAKSRKRVKLKSGLRFTTEVLIGIIVGLLLASVVVPSVYKVNFTHLKNIIFMEEVLNDDYIDQEALENRMKEILGNMYSEEDEDRFYRYATKVILADVSKAHGDEFYQRWGKYNYWISQDVVDSWDQSDSVKTASNLYEPYEYGDAYYVKFNTFSDQNADDQFLSHVEEMAKYKTVIVDLRGNGGGYVSVANNIADAFVDKDALLVSFENTNTVDEFFAKKDKSVDAKVIVLMNKRTASASEIFILALQGNGVDVTTIGEASFGKGLGSTSRRAITLPFQEGLGEINILNFFWYGPNHESILNDGVIPDVAIELGEDETINEENYKNAILTILNNNNGEN